MKLQTWLLLTVMATGASAGCDKPSNSPSRPLGGNCEKDNECERPLFCAPSGKVAGTCTLSCTAVVGETECEARFGAEMSFCRASDNICARKCKTDSECEGRGSRVKDPLLGNRGEVGQCIHSRAN